MLGKMLILQNENIGGDNMGVRFTDIDKELIKEVVREMILGGEIKISTADREVYSNEGRHYGQEEALVLSVKKQSEELDWDNEPLTKHVQQDYSDGVVLSEVEITGW